MPNPTTVWLFRERLREAKIFQRLFEQFHRALSSQTVKLKRGQIVDASFVEVPRQCNTREENETIKDGAVPAQWTKNPATLRQRDVDARWTQKNDEDHYGDKIHVSVDRKTKLVIEEQAMAANVHDSQVFAEVLGMGKKRGRVVWAVSAYRSSEHERQLRRKGFHSLVHERAYRGRPLSARQQRANRTTSHARVRVAHVFAAMTQMGGMTVRSIGIERMKVCSTMKALSYNLRPLEVLFRLGKIPIEGIGVPA